MQSYRQDFIRFALECEALRFGEFVLKSGRVSPYFFNSGLFDTGARLARLGRFYAAAIQESGIEFDMLYGPAYKGIPLACAVAIALSDEHGRDLPYCFNRKEAKDHGEGGVIVGAAPRGRVLIVDDVVSAGTSVRESLAILGAADATCAAVAISLDRQERGQGERSATQEIEETHGMPVISIIGLADLIAFLETDPTRRDGLDRVRAYRDRYGVDSL